VISSGEERGRGATFRGDMPINPNCTAPLLRLTPLDRLNG
jgi:hypothetical protein